MQWKHPTSPSQTNASHKLSTSNVLSDIKRTLLLTSYHVTKSVQTVIVKCFKSYMPRPRTVFQVNHYSIILLHDNAYLCGSSNAMKGVLISCSLNLDLWSCSFQNFGLFKTALKVIHSRQTMMCRRVEYSDSGSSPKNSSQREMLTCASVVLLSKCLLLIFCKCLIPSTLKISKWVSVIHTSHNALVLTCS